MESDDAELTMADEVRELQAALDSALDENERLRAASLEATANEERAVAAAERLRTIATNAADWLEQAGDHHGAALVRVELPETV